MRRVFLTVALTALLLIIGAYVAYFGQVAFRGEQSPEMRNVEVAGRLLRVAVADSIEERARGLSGRAGLAPDEGMLFVFPEDGKYSFWMKDMRFPIDILWLSSDGVIVRLVPSVSPDTYPQSFSSERVARYVLELPAGYSEAHDIHVGDNAEL